LSLAFFPEAIEQVGPASGRVHRLEVFNPAWPVKLKISMFKCDFRQRFEKLFENNRYFARFFRVWFWNACGAYLPGEAYQMVALQIGYPSPVDTKVVGANLGAKSADLRINFYFLKQVS